MLPRPALLEVTLLGGDKAKAGAQVPPLLNLCRALDERGPLVPRYLPPRHHGPELQGLRQGLGQKAARRDLPGQKPQSPRGVGFVQCPAPPAPLPEIICPLLTLARHPSRQMTFKRNQQAAEQLSASVGRRWRVLGASVQDPGGRDETEPGGRDETEPGAGAEPCGAGSRRQALGCPSPECQVWAGFATCN